MTRTELLRMLSNRKNLAVVAIAVVVLSAGALYFSGSFPTQARPQKIAALQNLPVYAVTRRDIVQTIEVPAEFTPFQEADLDAKVDGYVKKLDVDVGSIVKQGQVLATIEVPELKDELRRADAALLVARNQAGKAQAQYTDEKTIYDRLAGVMKAHPELIAQQEVDEAKAKADGAYANLIAAQSAIAEAQANLTRVHDMDAYTTIYAPFDGAITKRYVNEGALVGTGGSGAANALFHISDITHLRLVANIPEKAVPNIAVGKIATVVVTDLGRTYQLPIARISHQLNQQTRTMHVECDFYNKNDGGGSVAPGMFARVQVPLSVHDQVLAVPVQALHNPTDDGQGTLYLLGADGSASTRQVRLGLASPDYIEIASGLSGGEQVAVGVVPRLDGDIRYAAVPAKLQ